MDVIAHALSGALIGQALAPDARPETYTAMTILGAVAGVAPDLDFLCELKGKLAGWRYHRVALHGIPMLPLLAAPLVLGALTTTAAQAGVLRIVLTVVAALASHLLLDVVTSFGTALLYPFTRRRFSTRSHFIADPLVLVMLGLGLVAARPVTALLAVAAYMASSSAVRAWLTRKVRRSLLRLGKLDPRPVLEPRLLSPWRWLVILDDGDSYLVGEVTPLSLGRWQRTQSGREGPAAPLARQSELLCAFLDTCDFPRFELRADRTLVVEDVKWWLELPFRPLAFTAQVGDDGVPGTPRQSAMSDRGPAGITERPPLEPVPGQSAVPLGHSGGMPSDEERAPIHLAPGAGRSYAMGPLQAVFKADGDETRNKYSISEWWLEPYTRGPGAHSHEEDDVFFVIEGTMSFFLGGAWIDAPKGSLVIAPGGTAHDFENRTGERAGALNLSVPGDFEPQMESIAAWFRARAESDSRTANAPESPPAGKREQR